MEKKSLVSQWQQHTGIYGIIGLWIPFFLFWIGTGLYTPVLHVVSGQFIQFIGRFFSEPFNYHYHAGSALDQPTIGKFLFWYTAFSCTAIVWAVFIYAVSNVRIPANRKTYAIILLAVFFWAMCLLFGPACLLLQYVWSMGITITRLFGIGYSFFSILAWIICFRLLTRKRTPQEEG